MSILKRRYENISKASKQLSEEAYKAYTGKKDYKRAIEIYSILAESNCVPDDISNFAKNMLSRLSKKIEENT
jgi:transcription initiation factor IIE alpha subunit